MNVTVHQFHLPKHNHLEHRLERQDVINNYSSTHCTHKKINKIGKNHWCASLCVLLEQDHFLMYVKNKHTRCISYLTNFPCDCETLYIT